MPFQLIKDGVIQAVHDEICAHHGGRTGLREVSMMKMLYARAHVLNMSSATDLASLAACYGYGLAHDQPFHVANLPTALVVIELFLTLNGYRLNADDTACFLGLMVVAQGELSAEAFASWIRNHVVPL
ncbi:type II toxin-antitoxin system death-on-curing family toxin [Asticcacaulis sp. AC402]|uniref:type II toxin-antitoxin system death-on-curing family toxin n=1 Tax=Asticcacaulis sp. AC402 TaxID=1282361 RepID=UPI0003C3E207|nr:hypothetical protein [Asticcacaulis sp. AC402]ESQ75056.1 hypothetical protein ABAC402_11670 [Asticcacaulis sp. AC402]